jgi:hypothetical protein
VTLTVAVRDVVHFLSCAFPDRFLQDLFNDFTFVCTQQFLFQMREHTENESFPKLRIADREEKSSPVFCQQQYN